MGNCALCGANDAERGEYEKRLADERGNARDYEDNFTDKRKAWRRV